MVSENDNDNQRNSGRLQSSSLGVGQIKKQIEKGMKDGIKKEIGSEKAIENIKRGKPVEDLKEEIWKRLERENEIMGNKNADYGARKSLKEEFKADQARIKDVSARQTAALKYKKESAREAEKEANKRLKEMEAMQGSRIKRKIASKVVGKVVSEMAYEIAQKMAERANRGGINAIVIILVTLILAIWIDAIDILMEIGLAVAVASLVGAIPGAVVGFLIWLSNFFLSLIIVFFWMAVLGGGHKKWFWKRVARLFFLVIFVEAIPYVDLLPWTIFTVCWNWYDFEKDKRKAKKDSKEFKIEFQKTSKINKKYAGYF
jgi:hypothetical protein